MGRPIPVSCEWCGNSFMPNPGNANRFCSRACSGKSSQSPERNEAKKKGLLRYLSDNPCAAGHAPYRYISTGVCCECIRLSGTAWKIANPSAIQLSKTKWAKRNPQKVSAMRKAWRLANLERCRLTAQRWREENRELRQSYSRNRRALDQLADGHHNGEDVSNILIAQKFKCALPWCRKTLKRRYHVDHIMPLARGGSNWPRNLQILCPTCNLQKHAKHPVQFVQQHGLLL